MRKVLLILIGFFTLVGCSKKDSEDLNKEHNLNKQKEILQSLGFDLTKVTIHTDTTGIKSTKLTFSSIAEAKTYFSKLLKSNTAFIDTLKLLSKSPEKFSSYTKKLMETAKVRNANKIGNAKISTTSIDYSQNHDFNDQEVDNLDAIWENCELTAPGIDYDPTTNFWRWLSDYNNDVFSGHRGTARMKKWVLWTCFNLQFDWDFSANTELVKNVQMYTSGLSILTKLYSHSTSNDFYNFPGSAIIYFQCYGDFEFDLSLAGNDISFGTSSVIMGGWYNTNNGKYWIEN